METVAIEKKQFDELLSRLDKVTTLLALNLVKVQEKQKDKIIFLSSFGYGVTEISKLLNMSVGTVNQALIRNRKEKNKTEAEVPKENKTDDLANEKSDAKQ
jgi:DNA-directed RNA polymerase specialized sigma24 family protein